jgi:hypothetical protein
MNGFRPMRTLLLVLLGFGVVAGFKSGFRAHQGGSCEHSSWWTHHERAALMQAPAPTPPPPAQAPVAVAAAAAPAPSPQIIFVMPPAAAAPQPQAVVIPQIIVPSAATVAPAAHVP